jgi:hypothetical protein
MIQHSLYNKHEHKDQFNSILHFQGQTETIAPNFAFDTDVIVILLLGSLQDD